jgi:mono/diheme cytochrome c family protein
MKMGPVFVSAVLGAGLNGLVSAAGAPPSDDSASLERGRYLVTLGGCNDCHTLGYPQSGGQVPEPEWLTGNPVGFRGPWGTTYPANLRLIATSMSENAWVTYIDQQRRPPMPWFNLVKMTEDDRRAMYRFIVSLGAKGEAAPAYAPPGQAVATPFIEFFPKNTVSQTTK